MLSSTEQWGKCYAFFVLTEKNMIAPALAFKHFSRIFFSPTQQQQNSCALISFCASFFPILSLDWREKHITMKSVREKHFKRCALSETNNVVAKKYIGCLQASLWNFLFVLLYFTFFFSFHSPIMIILLLTEFKLMLFSLFLSFHPLNFLFDAREIILSLFFPFHLELLLSVIRTITNNL